MAKDNSWKTVAEIYRDREHKLINQLQALLLAGPVTDGRLESLLNSHLTTTGRTPGKPVEVPVIIPPVDGARSELLALLGVSEGQQRALQAGTVGRVRKVRSDKGKPRGPRKKKVTV